MIGAYASLQTTQCVVNERYSHTIPLMCIDLHCRSVITVREGQFWHTSAAIEFPHQIFRGPCHPKPITRCHVALFDKIYLIYAKCNLHIGYISWCIGCNSNGVEILTISLLLMI
jgi:hypothetical protein